MPSKSITLSHAVKLIILGEIDGLKCIEEKKIENYR